MLPAGFTGAVVDVSMGPRVAVVGGSERVEYGVEDVVDADGFVLETVACRNVELVFDSS